MAIIVIGGQSRSVGKTSVVAGLIAALRDHHWTAFKITQYGHGICSRDGAACDCATADHAWAISEERERAGASDTSRFLLAGAERAWWVRTEQGRLAEALPAIRRRLAEAENAIFESNSVVKFIQPDLYLTVLDPATADFKKSAQEFLDRADAVILHGGKPHADERRDGEPFAWESISLKPAAGRPVFRVQPPEYVTEEIVEFVRGRMECKRV
ncbi:MAG: hypothetical protein ABSE92_04210 [Terriglobales bacterium]|jgi:hypothetical protein